ncbi:uncharacterized protein I303_103496 [Kwoniella dejecticola CBS 10117]|uniref:Uncharacterized protein n=1 Tax=Kwoniella dejecticola CBS 10117 TaxID=1296121 RepID=A0A1A6A6X1_9TREE|nr:uncharacterized protein I303_03519 [Kwoniella dejecticola CBS 10117]OBR85806.1 hypothetical protein I303_03519 [Kwoniella dejecticola CBS 10117]
MSRMTPADWAEFERDLTEKAHQANAWSGSAGNAEASSSRGGRGMTEAKWVAFEEGLRRKVNEANASSTTHSYTATATSPDTGPIGDIEQSGEGDQLTLTPTPTSAGAFTPTSTEDGSMTPSAGIPGLPHRQVDLDLACLTKEELDKYYGLQLRKRNQSFRRVTRAFFSSSSSAPSLADTIQKKTSFDKNTIEAIGTFKEAVDDCLMLSKEQGWVEITSSKPKTYLQKRVESWGLSGLASPPKGFERDVENYYRGDVIDDFGEMLRVLNSNGWTVERLTRLAPPTSEVNQDA